MGQFTSLLKRLSSFLPKRYQQELKRLHFARRIRAGMFRTEEPEFTRLGEWVKNGDWVLDVGANVGHYAARLSDLVGSSGRVFAFEPVPDTFELLSANIARLRYQNVTLLNVAASEFADIVGVHIPQFDTGIDNYYMAQLTREKMELSVFCMPVDAVQIPSPVKFAKIDVEGHELSVLKGMEKMLKRDHPVLVVEGVSDAVLSYLTALGYSFRQEIGSPNRVYLHETCLSIPGAAS